MYLFASAQKLYIWKLQLTCLQRLSWAHFRDSYLVEDALSIFISIIAQIASKTLAREFIQTSKEAIEKNYAHQNVQWHFFPPGALHMGGLWEAGVESFKAHIRKIGRPFNYTFEEFSTILAWIEACLNFRPIFAQSENPSDLSALTFLNRLLLTGSYYCSSWS